MKFSGLFVIAWGLLHAVLSERKEAADENVLSVEQEDDSGMAVTELQAKLIPPPVRQAFAIAIRERAKAIKNLEVEEQKHQEAVKLQENVATNLQEAKQAEIKKAEEVQKKSEEAFKKAAVAMKAKSNANSADDTSRKAAAVFDKLQQEHVEAQEAFLQKIKERERLMKEFDAEISELEAKTNVARQKSEDAKLHLETAQAQQVAAGELKQQELQADMKAREELDEANKASAESRKALEAKKSEFQNATEELDQQRRVLDDAKQKKAEQNRIHELIKLVRSSISSRSGGSGGPGVDVAFGDVVEAAQTEEVETEMQDSDTPWLVFAERLQKPLAGAAKAYNYFVAVASLIRDLDPVMYGKCLEADKHLREWGFEDIKAQCVAHKGDELDEAAVEQNCGTGLWEKLGVEIAVMQPAPTEAAPMEAKQPPMEEAKQAPMEAKRPPWK